MKTDDPNTDEINQRLSTAIRATINQQIAEKDPIETLLTLERLQEEGFSENEAYTLLGQAVSREVAEVIVMELPFNLERFIRALELLPEPFAKAKPSGDQEDESL
ncbi:MAG: hypothetical protein OEY59_02675 [Deltaproteobacteria bacterium]|nr:hypothetical protein [Deltaproteobacteria bacterium]